MLQDTADAQSKSRPAFRRAFGIGFDGALCSLASTRERLKIPAPTSWLSPSGEILALPPEYAVAV